MKLNSDKSPITTATISSNTQPSTTPIHTLVKRSYSTAAAKVPLTADAYPYLKRNTAFATLNDQDIAHFKQILKDAGSSAVLTDSSDVEPFNEDWMRKYKGQSRLVLKPKTTEQVSAILKHCNTRNLAVVPQGGNTGLVGGSVPVFDEIVISLANMNAITDFDEVSGIVTCQAGTVLEVLDGYLAERGHIMPLDLGAKGTCQIGGNVATNAGGLRLLRYGSLHGTVLSMEVVTADGSILKLGQPLRKDNTGYDLKHLFIGSEGTLGIITSVSILAPRRPTSVNVATLALPNFESVQKTFVKAKTDLGEILSAYEFWDSSCFKLVMKHVHGARNPFPASEDHSPFYVLIETSGSNKEHDEAKLSEFLESLFTEELVTDGVLAETDTQIQSMWAFRESIPEACARDGKGGNLKYDLSVPVSELYNCVETMRSTLVSKGLYGKDSGRIGEVVGFGHMGDGNLHLNITGAGWDKDVVKVVEPFVYEWVKERNGSISAEHGLGLMKAPYIEYSKDKEVVDLMQSIKNLWDPNGIMNPYNQRKPSAIRSLQKFMSTPGIISLGGGNPHPSTFPYTSISFTLRSGEKVDISEADVAKALQYSPTNGLPELVEWLKSLQAGEHLRGKAFPEGWDVCVGNGSQDVLTKAFEMLIAEGETMLIESPAYVGSLAFLRPLGAKFAEIAVDSQGLVPESMESILANWKDPKTRPKVLYTVPTGGNPTGTSTTHERKKQIYSIAQKYGVIILEDDPYYYLQFSPSRTPSYFSMDEDGRVLRFDSFSKILSSGVRIWGISGFLSHTTQVSEFYKKKGDAFLQAANKHLTGLAEWTTPSAGMFVWIKLLGITDSSNLIKEKAVEKKVLLVPGFEFFPNPRTTSYVRASFSTATEEEIDIALGRLAALVRDAVQEQQKKKKGVAQAMWNPVVAENDRTRTATVNTQGLQMTTETTTQIKKTLEELGGKVVNIFATRSGRVFATLNSRAAAIQLAKLWTNPHK
ncbi:hypothetical protein HDV05_006199 [Chytridiales sp. JEL 0842]|nr:hypothetical protein HDV05_006199 [Chytridiales sp. JEL 0842]